MKEYAPSNQKYFKDKQFNKKQKSENFLYRENKKKTIKKILTFFKIMLLIILLLIMFLILDSNNNRIINIKYFKRNYLDLINLTSVNNKITINNDLDFSKFKKFLPHLSPDLNAVPKNKEELFNARQIYISDAKITPEYIRYIRPIDENDEKRYKNQSTKNENIVDIKLFEKRKDQFNYIDYCNLSLAEILINDIKMENEIKPIISIVVPSYIFKIKILKI